MIDLLRYIGILLSIPCALLLCLKLAEMLKNIHWAARVKEEVVNKLSELLATNSPDDFTAVLSNSNFPFFPGSFRLTKWMTKTYANKVLQGLFVFVREVVFRYTTLMFLCSLLTVVVVADRSPGDLSIGIRALSGILGLLLLLGIWIKVMHLLVYRFRFGAADNHLLSLSVPTMRQQVSDIASRRLALQKFLIVVLSSLATFLVGYSAIYVVVISQAPPDQQFKGISSNVPLFIQAFYFSTATFLTVGFGDISPIGWLAMSLVTTEMILGLLLLVIFITAFAATFPSKD